MQRMLAGLGPTYIFKRLGRGKSGLQHFDKRAMASYVRAFKDPRTIHATCEDYRAAATIDLFHDKKDLSKDRKDRNQDQRDINKDKRDLHKDHKDLRHDKRGH